MSKLKKVLLMCTAYALVAALAIGGTIAYLQDDDSDVNVMTLGNVSIEQHEYERATNTDGSYETKEIDGVTSYVLKDFTQGKPLLPSAVVVSSTPWDSTTVRMSQVDSYGGMQTFLPVTNAQDKFVTVENTGKTDAYIRTLVAIEVGTANPDLISFGNHFTWKDNQIGIITIDGNNYYLHEFTYDGWQAGDRHVGGILPAGDTSYPSLSQVYIKPEATNEDMVALDGNGNGTLDILVLSQAVQVAGFADANTALDAAFGDITTTSHPWSVEAPVIPNTVTSVEDVANALEAGETDIILTAGTYTFPDADFSEDVVLNCVPGTVFEGTSALDVNGATVVGATFSNDTGNVAASSIEGTFKNCTFTGYNVLSSGTTDGDVIFENCIIDGDNYGIHFDSGVGENNIVFKNCTIIGYTTFAASIESVIFEDCEFVNEATEPSGATQVNIWGGEATFKNCHFDEFFWMIFVPGDATINIDNVTYDGDINDFFYQEASANVTWNFEGTVYTVKKY